jgi:predicted O-methyltransferase YrrM
MHLIHGKMFAVAEVHVTHSVVTVNEHRGVYDVVFIDIGKRRMQVTVSPTGKSIQVHVDGKRVHRG